MGVVIEKNKWQLEKRGIREDIVAFHGKFWDQLEAVYKRLEDTNVTIQNLVKEMTQNMASLGLAVRKGMHKKRLGVQVKQYNKYLAQGIQQFSQNHHLS